MSVWRFLFDDPVWRGSAVDAHGRRRRRDTRLLLHRARDVEGRIDSLEEEVRELALVCRSLLEVLAEAGTVDPLLLERVMRRIDGESSLGEGRMHADSHAPPSRSAPTWSRRRE